MNDTINRMTALFRFLLTGEPLPEKETLSSESAAAVYALAAKHDLAHLAAEAIDAAGLKDKLNAALAERFRRAKLMAIYRHEKRQYEFRQICALLERMQIPYIPLKGLVMQDLWLEPWMRTCHDLDILVQETHLRTAIARICDELGYRVKICTTHDVTLTAPNGVILELHHGLLDKTRTSAAAELLSSIWSHAEPAGDGFAYRLTPAMFLFVHLAHMVEHFENGGCGLRPFLDLYLLCRTEQIRAAADDCADLVARGGLTAFAAAAYRLATHWMDGAPADENTLLFQDYILSGGVYGNLVNRIAVTKSNPDAHGYLAGRLFWRFDRLSGLYPILKKHKWLFPLMQVRRWFDRVRKKGLSPFVRELSVNRSYNASVSDTQKNALKTLRAYLGL